MREADGTLRFHPAAPPTDADVRRVVVRVRRRLDRLGVTAATGTDGDVDPLAEESVTLAGLSQAAVLGRAALGSRAGRGPLPIGADPDAPWVDRHVPWHAHEAGFDLHAAGGMQNEHFGMAVAELARAGTIVFAHASGPQTAILAVDSRRLRASDVTRSRRSAASCVPRRSRRICARHSRPAPSGIRARDSCATSEISSRASDERAGARW